MKNLKCMIVAVLCFAQLHEISAAMKGSVEVAKTSIEINAQPKLQRLPLIPEFYKGKGEDIKTKSSVDVAAESKSSLVSTDANSPLLLTYDSNFKNPESINLTPQELTNPFSPTSAKKPSSKVRQNNDTQAGIDEIKYTFFTYSKKAQSDPNNKSFFETHSKINKIITESINPQDLAKKLTEIIKTNELQPIAQIRDFVSKNPKIFNADSDIQKLLDTKLTKYTSKSGIKYNSPDQFMTPEVKTILDSSNDQNVVDKALQNLIINSDDDWVVSNVGNLYNTSSLTRKLQWQKFIILDNLKSNRTIPEKINTLNTEMTHILNIYKTIQPTQDIVEAVEKMYTDEISKLEKLGKIEKEQINNEVAQITDSQKSTIEKINSIATMDTYKVHQDKISKLAKDLVDEKITEITKKPESLQSKIQELELLNYDSNLSRAKDVLDRTDTTIDLSISSQIGKLKEQLNRQGEESITAAFNNIYNSLGSSRNYKLVDTLPILFRTIRTAISNLFAGGKMPPETKVQLDAIENKITSDLANQKSDTSVVKVSEENLMNVWRDAVKLANQQKTISKTVHHQDSNEAQIVAINRQLKAVEDNLNNNIHISMNGFKNALARQAKLQAKLVELQKAENPETVSSQKASSAPTHFESASQPAAPNYAPQDTYNAMSLAELKNLKASPSFLSMDQKGQDYINGAFKKAQIADIKRQIKIYTTALTKPSSSNAPVHKAIQTQLNDLRTQLDQLEAPANSQS